MSANLYPGIKSLHLVLDTPYDLIRTDDVRDDLIGVKVWYSTTPNFNPKAGQGTLAFDGSGLSITISDLDTNTQYYVKYAFISAIDPAIFTVSAQLTATVYDENTNIYGYLTNDPSSVFTEQDGSGGDYTATQGIFKVFELSQDVTGAGPVYSIKPGGITGGVTGVIDPVTGVYYATAMVSNTGTITFYATYKGVVVEKVWNLTKIRDGVDGTDAPNLRVSSTGNAFVYKDDFAQDSQSGSITISTTITNLTGTPTYTALAYTRAGVLLGPVTLVLQDSKAILSASNFNPQAYSNTVGYVTVTSQLALISDSITIYRTNDGSEQITVEQTNQAHTITAFNDGSVPAGNYVGSGNIIRVKQGNTYLQLDNFSPYANGTWRLTNIDSVGITADPTPTIGSDYVDFDQHANMIEDVAHIDYQITGKTTTGKPFVLTVRQSFSKSKAGVIGSDAPAVNLTSTTQTFVVAKNTGTVTPNIATLTATITNMENETIAWYVDDVLQTGQTNSVFSIASFTGIPKIIKVVATSGAVTAFDQLTLYSLREGDDSLQAGLVNENQTVSCDSSGEPIAGQLPVTSAMVVVRGAQVLTSGVVYSRVEQVNVTATINATTGVISVSAISDVSGYAVFRATIGSITLDKRLTLNKSLNGQRGLQGQTGEGVSQIYIRSDLQPQTPNPSETTPSGWSPTVAGTTGTAGVWTSFGSRLAGSTIYTWQAPVRVQGEAGNPLRNASGFLYFSTAQASSPGAPSASGFNFATGTFSSVSSGWNTTFNVPSGTTTALWAVRYSVQETAFNGAQTVSISNPFTHQNFDGLVTFSNNQYVTSSGATSIANSAATSAVSSAAGNYATNTLSNVTTIDGGKITTGSLTADRLEIGKVRTGDYIRMFDNRIIVYTGNQARVIIGFLG